MKNKVTKIGDWVFITASNKLSVNFFNNKYPRGIFGRIIKIEQYYSGKTGRRLPLEIKIRAYMSNGISHLKMQPKYIKP